MRVRWSASATAIGLIVSLVSITPMRLLAQSKEIGGLAGHVSAPAASVCRYGDWLVAETPNFWVCCGAETLPAEQIGQHCQTLYRQLCQKWLAVDSPTNWTPKCAIVLHPNRERYLAAVGPEAAMTAGSSVVERRAGRTVGRRIDLRADRPDYLTAALPHELTHVILADHFAGQSLPRWADEGMAILADTETKRALHIRDLEAGCLQGATFRIAELLSRQDYPPPERWGVFYGQSTSLVQYLVARGTPHQFVKFVEHAAAVGYDRALQESYGIDAVEALDDLWRSSLLSASPPVLAKMP